MVDPQLRIESDQNNRVSITGALDLYHFRQAKKGLLKAIRQSNGAPVIDLSGVTRLDSAGALLLRSVAQRKVKNAGAQVEITGVNEDQEAFLNLVFNADIQTIDHPKHRNAWVMMVERAGKASYDIVMAIEEMLTFLGQACIELAKAFRHPSHLRLASITRHIEESGINAIPIISTIAFLISVILAYQGLAQLKPLGASQYTVNLIAISVLREMGVLLTAIIVAGRSGSAFTAEIGVMKVREEVDALRTIGFNPFEVLVLPRIIGLVIALPLLTFIADMMGLLGGGITSLTLMDITAYQYIERVHHTALAKDMMVGLIKAPVFALVIALVGCMHGLKVTGSAESVGRETTASVVKSIFMVLMIDGLFSIYFGKIHL